MKRVTLYTKIKKALRIALKPRAQEPNWREYGGAMPGAWGKDSSRTLRKQRDNDWK